MLLLEFLDSADEEEAIECVKELPLETPGVHSALIARILNLAIEKKAPEREALASLLTVLYKKKIISPSHFLAGYTLLCHIFIAHTIYKI